VKKSMKLRHPFEWLSKTAQKRAFVVLLVLAVVVMVSLQVFGSPLKTRVAPFGIVSFEFAGEQSQAKAIVESWGARAQVYAGLNLGLDYLFLVAYAGSIGLGCVLVAQSLAKRAAILYSAGVFLAWGQILAALLDSVENYALIRILLGSVQEQWSMVALWCAAPKFMIVALGLVYFLVGGVVVLVARIRWRNGHAA
jgi:hypothetical protein